MKPPRISGPPLKIAKDRSVPAPRYELFISAFEKKVAEIQQSIRQMEKMEQLYNLVREAGQKFRLPNEQKIELSESEVRLRITALPDDSLAETFDALALAIGQSMVEAGLRSNPEPAVYMGGTAVVYTLHCGAYCGSAYLSVKIPDDGIRDAKIRIEPAVSHYNDYRVVRLPEARPIGWNMKGNNVV